MEKIKQCKFQITIGLLVILFIVYYTYSNSSYQRLQGEYTIIQAQYKAQKKSVILLEHFRKKEKDSLNSAITSREKENENLKLQEKNLQDKIDSIKKRPFREPTDLKSSVVYYNTKYKTIENIVVENKVGLGLVTSRAVIADLEEGNNCEEVVVLKDEQLANKDIMIINLKTDKEDLGTLVSSAEKTIEANKLLQKLADKNINNLTKQNKKLKSKNFLNKVLVPVALVVGGFTGVQITK